MSDNLIPPIKCRFQSLRYKITKWCHESLRLTTFLDISGGVASGVAMILAYSTHPSLATLSGLIFIFSVTGKVVIILKDKRSLEQLKTQIIHQHLHYINKKLFGEKAEHRFTLFTIDPINRNYITPYVRFEVGGIDGKNDAEQSNARYSKGMGYTGMAWKIPKELHSRVFPEFKNREDFECYYVNQLKIPREIVHEISHHMVKVRQILCYGFVDSKDQFLGVLSLDSNIVWQCKPDEMTLLEEILGLTRTLLESLFCSK